MHTKANAVKTSEWFECITDFSFGHVVVEVGEEDIGRRFTDGRCSRLKSESCAQFLITNLSFSEYSQDLFCNFDGLEGKDGRRTFEAVF